MRRGRAAALAGMLLTASLLAGCGTSSEAPSGGRQSASPSPSVTPSGGVETPGADVASDPPLDELGSLSPDPSVDVPAPPYLPVPEGVTLTDPGSQLVVGTPATVAWEPRQSLIGALEIIVTGLERTSFKRSFVGWRLDEQTRTSRPYFVRAEVRNVGVSDLGGIQVPLYVLDGAGRLIEATRFDSRFRPCPSRPLPKTFAPGATRSVCLVYLVPDKGALGAVSFRPTQEFDPITWSGTVAWADRTPRPRPRIVGGPTATADPTDGASTD